MEIWKDIPSCSGYQASNIGNIRSVDRYIKRQHDKKPWLKRGKVLSSCNQKGYRMVNIRGKSLKVHRLVAEAFGLPLKNKVINHKDANPSNNRIKNLEAVTQAENMAHAARLGLIKGGENHSQNLIAEIQAKMIICLYANGFTNKEISRQFQLSQQHVGSIGYGRFWKSLDNYRLALNVKKKRPNDIADQDDIPLINYHKARALQPAQCLQIPFHSLSPGAV